MLRVHGGDVLQAVLSDDCVWPCDLLVVPAQDEDKRMSGLPTRAVKNICKIIKKMTRTNKQQWNLRHGFQANESHSRAEISKVSDVPSRVLQKVYDRGVGAHKTNPGSVRVKGSFKKNANAPISSKLSKEQWGMARVYSFVNKLEGRAKLNHDTDLVD